MQHVEIGKKTVGFILLAGAVVSLICFVVLFALRLRLAFSETSDIGGVEQNMAFGLQLMLNGQKLYMPPGDLPFYINQYNPVYFFLCYLTALVTDTGPMDLYPMYVQGRLWTLFFNLMSVLAVFQIGRSSFKMPVALAVLLGFSAFIFVYRQGFSLRPDSMMDACMLWAIYAYLRHLAGGQRSFQGLILPLSLGVLAFFIKQSGAVIPLIILGFLLTEGRFKRFLHALALVILLVALPALALRAYYGAAFLESAVGGINNGVSLFWVRAFLWGNGLKTKVILPALICGYVLFVRFYIKPGNIQERFLAWCVAALFVFNAAVSLKAGSNIQYFHVFTCLALMLIVQYFFVRVYASDGEKLRGIRHIIPASAALGLVLALVVANTKHQFTWIKLIEIDNKDLVMEKERDAARVAEFVRSEIAPGHYAFANLHNERENLSLSGRRSVNNLLFPLCALPTLDVIDVSVIPIRVFDYALFDRYLITGKISYVIEGTPENVTNMKTFTQIRNRYFQPVKRIGGYTIFRHRDQSPKTRFKKVASE